MKILFENPPNIAEIQARFDVPKGAVFCYGDTIYNPSRGNVDKALIAHEETHSLQQKEFGVENWWNLYLHSSDFRLSQEVPAYQNQYREQKKWIKDRNQLHGYLRLLARDLSGAMYGDIMKFNDAMRVIQSKKIYKFDLTVAQKLMK